MDYQSAPLSRREREIMDIVCGEGEASVTQILEIMKDPPTRPALRSILTILESKGHLKHRKEGREFIYLTVYSKEKVGQSTISRVIRTFFDGSLPQALAAYLSDPKSRLTNEDISELETFIEEARTKSSRVEKKNSAKPL